MLIINPCIHVLVVGTPCPDKLAMVDGHNSRPRFTGVVNIRMVVFNGAVEVTTDGNPTCLLDAIEQKKFCEYFCHFFLRNV